MAPALVHEVDDFDLERFTAVAAGFGSSAYGFVVTPNVDHLIRYHDDPVFRDHYRRASYILMDSRFAAKLVRLVHRVDIPVCTGSDLTARIFSQVVRPDDRLVLIGGSEESAEEVRRRFGLRDLRHHNPPMGFIRNDAAVEECLSFIEGASPYRFCFLAVGSPQQEQVASLLKARGRARGLTLCVGASINFITGREKRAPLWMQRLALEWLYRLAHDPRRLAGRYLLRGPRIFAHLLRARVVLRRAAGGRTDTPDMRAQDTSQ
jgi:exopolysaccharide biosynthesis WecB/TagA/CpsF family protein